MSKPNALVQPHAAPAGQRHSPRPSAIRTPPALNSARSLLLRYGVALVSATVAILLRELLTPLWGAQLPFLTLFPAVLISAWYGGLGPGLVTTVLCTVAAAYFWLAPLYSLTISDPADQIGLALAVLVMLLITWLTAALRRAQEMLEHRVEERTAELERERARLTTTLEQLPVGVVITDAASRDTILANAQAKQSGATRRSLSPLLQSLPATKFSIPTGNRIRSRTFR